MQHTIFPVTDLPELGKTVWFTDKGRFIVIESYGSDVEITRADIDFYGSHLNGKRGERGCHCYFRAATAEEHQVAWSAAWSGRRKIKHECEIPKCGLTEEELLEVRESDKSIRKIAEKYGISRGSVWKIKHGRRWGKDS